MCGISGLIFRPGASAERLEAMVAAMTVALAHRGPDMAGTWHDAAVGVALGHRRLSILDLTPDGRQPMQSASGRYVISYNGEIYNFADIRERLVAVGVTVRGTSDTTVLLAAIDTWGLDATLPQLSGMFAFALWDRASRALHLVRDHCGTKPLYYGLSDGSLVFASELKAICAFPGFDRQVDRAALTAYFRHGYVPGPLSIWQGITKLPPGCVVTIDASNCALSLPPPRSYWSWSAMAEAQQASGFISDADAVDRLEHTLRTAVRDRMVADVPVGAFLSGGIDSSVIVALMQQESAQPVRTFTIGFAESDFDEASEARRVAARIGTRHRELVLSPAAARAIIPELAAIHDEPFADPSAIPMTHVARLAREDVTVCLSGDGGDELFGGYARYALAARLERRIGGLPRWLQRAMGSSAHAVPVQVWDTLMRRLPSGRMSLLRGALSGDRVHKLAALLANPDQAARYRQMTSVFADPAEIVRGGMVPADDTAAFKPMPEDPLHRMMLTDSLGYLPDDILVKVDRATMHCSLEARAPLLDRRVVELAWSLTPAMLTRDGRGKWPLRQLYDRLLPGVADDRAKRGFSVPIGDWLRGPLRDWAEDLLAAERLESDGLLNPAAVRRMWAEHLSGHRQWGAQLWAVLMVCSWAETWLTGASGRQQSDPPALVEVAA